MEYFKGMFGYSQSGDDGARRDQRPAAAPVSASTFAHLATDVYGSGAESRDIDGFRRVPPDELAKRGISPESLHTSSGMHAAVYEREGQVVVSYRGTVNPSASIKNNPYDGPGGVDPEADLINAGRGTEPSLQVRDVGQSARDWMTNLRQAMGMETSQHTDAVTLAKKVNDAYGTENVMYTGHSKGGGEAQLVGALFGRPTMVFNSAAPHEETFRRFGMSPEALHAKPLDYIVGVRTRGEVVGKLEGQSFSVAPLLDATVRSRVYGESMSSEDLPSSRIGRDQLTLRTPVSLGRNVDIEPDPKLGSVARHLMAVGVLPYLPQLSHVQLSPQQGAASEDRALSSQQRSGFPVTSLYQPLPSQGSRAESRAPMEDPSRAAAATQRGHEMAETTQPPQRGLGGRM